MSILLSIYNTTLYSRRMPSSLTFLSRRQRTGETESCLLADKKKTNQNFIWSIFSRVCDLYNKELKMRQKAKLFLTCSELVLRNLVSSITESRSQSSITCLLVSIACSSSADCPFWAPLSAPKYVKKALNTPESFLKRGYQNGALSYMVFLLFCYSLIFRTDIIKTRLHAVLNTSISQVEHWARSELVHSSEDPVYCSK